MVGLGFSKVLLNASPVTSPPKSPLSLSPNGQQRAGGWSFFDLQADQEESERRQRSDRAQERATLEMWHASRVGLYKLHN